MKCKLKVGDIVQPLEFPEGSSQPLFVIAPSDIAVCIKGTDDGEWREGDIAPVSGEAYRIVEGAENAIIKCPRCGGALVLTTVMGKRRTCIKCDYSYPTKVLPELALQEPGRVRPEEDEYFSGEDHGD